MSKTKTNEQKSNKNLRQTVIQFELRKNMMIIPIFVNNKGPLNFMVDTCAEQSVLGTATASMLSLMKLKEKYQKASGAGGEVTVKEGVIDTLQVGDIRLNDRAIVVADLSFIKAKLGVEIHGIIGCDILKDYEITINYKNRELRFAPLS